MGTLAASGTACPASGWWRCQEAQALDGTRWFAQGSLLPPATFALPAGVIRRRVAWQLVRPAPIPDHEPRFLRYS